MMFAPPRTAACGRLPLTWTPVLILHPTQVLTPHNVVQYIVLREGEYFHINADNSCVNAGLGVESYYVRAQ